MLWLRMSARSGAFDEHLDFASRIRALGFDIEVHIGSDADGFLPRVEDPRSGKWLAVMASADEEPARAMALGAAAALSPESTAEDCRKALWSLSSTGDLTADAGPGPDRFGRSRVTDREGEIHALLKAGKSNMEIARTLEISLNTVRTRIRSLRRKLGATTRQDLGG